MTKPWKAFLGLLAAWVLLDLFVVGYSLGFDDGKREPPENKRGTGIVPIPATGKVTIRARDGRCTVQVWEGESARTISRFQCPDMESGLWRLERPAR